MEGTSSLDGGEEVSQLRIIVTCFSDPILLYYTVKLCCFTVSLRINTSAAHPPQHIQLLTRIFQVITASEQYKSESESP